MYIHTCHEKQIFGTRKKTKEKVGTCISFIHVYVKIDLINRMILFLVLKN